MPYVCGSAMYKIPWSYILVNILLIAMLMNYQELTFIVGLNSQLILCLDQRQSDSTDSRSCMHIAIYTNFCQIAY